MSSGGQSPPTLDAIFFFARLRGFQTSRDELRSGQPLTRSMSFSTPAAVTAGPAPGPVMTSGFLR